MTFPHTHWAQPLWLYGMLAVPLVALLMVWAAWRRRVAARLFASALPPSTWKHRILRARAGLLLAAVALIPVALARPQWHPREEEVSIKGRDVVFLVDVSRSMLAQDVSPSRLGKAKLWINDVTVVGGTGARQEALRAALEYRRAAS